MEKRSEQRYMVNWPLLVCRRSRVWVNCKTVDISAAGLLFISTDRYRAAELVRLEITIRPTVIVHGVARIVREIGSSGRCSRYAAEFMEFSADGRRLLKEILLAIRRRSLNDSAAEDVSPAASPPETGADSPPTAKRHSRGPIVIRRGGSIRPKKCLL